MTNGTPVTSVSTPSNVKCLDVRKPGMRMQVLHLGEAGRDLGRSSRSFECGPALDNILFTSLSQKLDGFRLTRFKNAIGPQRTIRALRALCEEFEISRDEVEH